MLNDELATAICERDRDIVKEKVIGVVGRRFRFGVDISSEIEFIASHFCEFCEWELKELDETVLSRILSSDRLKIASENLLYKQIWKLVESDRKYFTMLQFVQFEFVSTDIARHFIERGSSFIEFVDLSIWSSLGRRFVQNISPSTSNSRVTGKAIMPEFKSLDGVVSYLTTKHGGNVHDKGVISVTSSAVYASGYDLRNAVDLQNKSSMFCSKNEPKSWICYEMKTMEIILTHYSILSSPFGPNLTHHPKSWYVEVSLDGQEWREVHRCGENSDLNGSNQIGTYEVNEWLRCRFVRLQRSGQSHYNDNYLQFSGFEIFGIIHEQA
jgi:hypothetical protein